MSPPRHFEAGRVSWRLIVIVGLAALLLLGMFLASSVLFQRSIRQPIEGAYTAAPAPAASSAPAPTAASAAAPTTATAPEAVRADAPPSPAAATVASASVASRTFRPPSEDSIPNDEYGKMIRLGQKVFTETGKYAANYVGNDLTCANCHLDAGRKPDSAPLWASFIHYPAFRSKTGQVDTLAARLQGCFQYSMNGKAPPQDDEVMTALQTYAFFLAKGAPVGMPVQGGGYPKLAKPGQPPSYARGEAVYAQNCALCHGADGQGQRAGDRQVFPPLWGPRSFNWGAGMHQVNNAAGFIYANMPLGKGRSLTEQEAWDVALFMDSHERPQDPRFAGSVAETRKKYHDSEHSLYGLAVNGRVLGTGARAAGRTERKSR
ncbi:c-type cytochrome [Ramlibacter sp.]|uniref:c-type cytochrome n=1 Tax=Ramlibacter sp. TaxID=1917967 RepID=UPI002BEF587E|nr:c-type cytochrome [Ramlibacter sp.]HWI83712.1 c-type cytochrome [Ramlibacter sp.]